MTDPNRIVMPGVRDLPADGQFLSDVAEELLKARRKHAPMHSHHEAYAVLLEEVEEYWEEVKKQKRDPEAMYLELLQIAAMACRAAVDCAPVPTHA